MTSPRRSRAMASPSSDPPTRRTSSTGTSRRIPSSGPSAATSRPTSPFTFLLFGPVPRSSPMMYGSWIRLVNPAAPGGRVQHADGEGLPALRADLLQRPGLLGLPPPPALAVPVQVVLPLLGEELDRARQAVPGAQRRRDGKVAELGVEHGGLPPQHRRGMRVGVADQAVPVQRGAGPVHRRGGGRGRGPPREGVRPQP